MILEDVCVERNEYEEIVVYTVVYAVFQHFSRAKTPKALS
jgi:hypothetical protein